MDKIKMGIFGLQYSQTQTGAYALVLEEESGTRRLPIIIGSSEAQAIAIELENMAPTRPLTHDLFRSFAQSFHIDIQEVIIYNFVDGVFYGKIVCTDGTEEVEIDCRPSDAIALAVRFKCPIFTHEFILNAAAFEKDNSGTGIRAIAIADDTPVDQGGFSQLTEDELEESLNAALAKEDYEEASLIRDELNRRKK
ncbi:MAG: bifunctional nuclease family protein [Flavobacteriales bacterium]|jgi:bifunctional DNase/RNase|nr:bifunctional nuclease family protein [Flavobacteriales bacterium]